MATAKHVITITEESYNEDTLVRGVVGGLTKTLEALDDGTAANLTLTTAPTRYSGWKRLTAKLTIKVSL